MNNLQNVFRILYRNIVFSNITRLGYMPRWIVAIIDIVIFLFSIFIIQLILNNMGFEDKFQQYTLYKVTILVGCNILFMLIFRTYAGIIRHSTFLDFFKILLASGSTLVCLLILNYCIELIISRPLFIYGTLFLYLMISVSIMFIFRLLTKQFFNLIVDTRNIPSKLGVAVIEVGEASVAIAQAIVHNPHSPYRLGGFLTSRSDSDKVLLLGQRIYNKDNFFVNDKIVRQFHAILLIKENMKQEEIEEWTSLALDKGLIVLKAPILSRSDLSKAISQLDIEDLLNRKPISIECNEVIKMHNGIIVLITGGAGSIGSEIVRQVSRFKPSLIVIVDQAESPLYDLEIELLEKFPEQKFKFILSDISNKYRLEKIFQDYHFSMVYHAAAYKHVPLMEENPHEAIFVNILGTKNLALLSKKYKINRFILVSTDKAVNPTNVMGASKRVAELFVQALQNTSGYPTKFITTRFGNVLGTNGSVIPHFRKQIERGGPVTITHPDIIRYFMTIPEACELLLQAGTMGDGGEIYVFDMGEPVKILDLAKRMIKLYGYIPDVEIKITFIGLRPGEKLYEELLSNNTTTIPTHHEKILISKDPLMEFEKIDILSQQVILAAMKGDKLTVVRILKKIVPEFISNNSEFEVLDKEGVVDNDI